VTVPETAAPAAPVNWNVEAVIEDDIIASLKVAVMVVLAATFVARFAGVTAVTVGATGGGGGGADDEPHPEIRSADARRQATPRRIRRIIWVLLKDLLWAERMAGPTRNPERKLCVQTLPRSHSRPSPDSIKRHGPHGIDFEATIESASCGERIVNQFIYDLQPRRGLSKICGRTTGVRFTETKLEAGFRAHFGTENLSLKCHKTTPNELSK
jgi:hypothetical protein